MLKRERKKNGPARDNNRLSKTRPQGSPGPSQSLATAANFEMGREQKQQPPTRGRPPPCPICEDKHFIAKCVTFNRATADERLEMLKKLRLCFTCCKTNHVSSECRTRSICDKCSKQHHTLLHGSTPKQSPSTGPPRGPPEQPQPQPPPLTSPQTQTLLALSTALLVCQTLLPRAGLCQSSCTTKTTLATKSKRTRFWTVRVTRRS